MRCRSVGEPGRRDVGRAELEAIAARLLQVIAQNLVELNEARAVLSQPVGEAFVQHRPGGLRQGFVCSVTDQEVPESVGIIVRKQGRVGPHQVLPHEGHEAAVDPGLVRRKRDDRPAVEDEPLDRSPLQHAALPPLELIEPGGEQRLDRRRHHDVVAVFRSHRNHLLDEERIALRGVEDSVAELVRDLATQGVDQLAGLL